jgi:hypothetical protein
MSDIFFVCTIVPQPVTGIAFTTFQILAAKMHYYFNIKIKFVVKI